MFIGDNDDDVVDGVLVSSGVVDIKNDFSDREKRRVGVCGGTGTLFLCISGKEGVWLGAGGVVSNIFGPPRNSNRSCSNSLDISKFTSC